MGKTSRKKNLRRPLTHKDATQFYLPLIFMAELMMVSHSIIHAFLARLENSKEALAAFAIAFSLQGLLAGFVVIMNPVALSFVTDRQSFFRTLRFGWSTSVLTSGAMWLVALTPLGDLFFGALLGAGPGVVVQAKWAALGFSFILPVVVVRQVANGVIMQHRRTYLITLGTLLRLGVLVGSLGLLTRFFPGAAAGALALFVGIFTETVFVSWVVRPFLELLPGAGKTPSSKDPSYDAPSYEDLWRFTWPLMVNQFSENGLAVLINIFLGRLLRADLALASFGVVRGLVMLLNGHMRNLAQTAQALVKTREDMRVMLRFSLRVILFLTGAVALLIMTPLPGMEMHSVMWMTKELS